MPFDFKKMKPYEIDYGVLFREVSKKHILYDKQIQENYLRNWLLELQKCDRILTTQLGNPDGFQICLKHMCEEPETFQFPIHFDHVTLFLHFRISYINKICNSQYTQGELVSLSEFQGPDKSICWTPVNNPVEQYATVLQPIIAVPYLNGIYKWLVIDGNHRVTYAVKHSRKRIPTLFLRADELIESTCLSSGFDSALYTFINEVTAFGNLTALGHKDAYSLLRKSYLAKGTPCLNQLIG